METPQGTTMPQRRRGGRHVLRATALTVALVITASLSTTGCDIYSRDYHWTLGKTHGVITENTAGRINLGIYRVPTNALREVLRKDGINKVQDLLWQFGKPPTIQKTISYQGVSVTLKFGTMTKVAQALAKHVIYHDDGDLKSALTQAASDKNCLAVTLISYGKPDDNWTNKNVGCKDGSLF